MGDAQDGLPGSGPAQQPALGLLARLKAAVKRLKREVLALSFAMHDPRTGLGPRAIAGLAIAYALSPIDLIPDFIPIVGLVDDLLILPGARSLQERSQPHRAQSGSLAASVSACAPPHPLPPCLQRCYGWQFGSYPPT